MSKPSELSRIPRLIGVEEAVRLSLESCRFPLEVEEVGVEESVGRVLAEDVVADQDRPARDEAFYDGYAVRSLDTVGASRDKPVRLRIVGSVDPTGRPGEVRLEEGEAAFTPCGAPLPEGADSVVRLEEALVEGGCLIVRREVKPSENVVKKGSDFRAGELLLPRGRMVRPQDLGLLMELGRSTVRVYRRVRVGVVPVGTDLVERARRGVSYPDSYARTIGSILRAVGAEVSHYPPVPDDVEEVKRALLASVKANDVTLAVGGVSVASNDTVPDAVTEIGEVVFHGVRVSPGKVSGLALVGGKPLFLVPAHVGSALACLLLFVIPAVAYRLSGVRDPYVKVKARLAEGVKGRSARHVFRPVALDCEGAECVARPIEKALGGSPFVSLFTAADGFIVVEAGRGAAPGEVVEVRLMPHLALNLKGASVSR